MNNSFYFQHDYNARNDQKILELRAEFGAEGYGIWWMLLETLAEQDEGINRGAIGGLSLAYGLDKSKLDKIINFCLQIGLLYDNNGYLRNERMDEHKKWRESLSQAGKKGAEKKWKNGPANGGAKAGLWPKNGTGQDRTGQDRTGNNKKSDQKKSGSYLYLTDIELGSFKEPWLDYLQHRKELGVKKYASQKSERQGFKKLYEYSGGDPDIAQKIVDQSRANSWQGLFPLKDNDIKKNDMPEKPPTAIYPDKEENLWVVKPPADQLEKKYFPVIEKGSNGELFKHKKPGSIEKLNKTK